MIPWRLAVALALCGEPGLAEFLVGELARYPKDIRITGAWLPLIRAALELQRGNPAQAIQPLERLGPHWQDTVLWSPYIRGLAYLSRQAGAAAAGEFQKILDHRGWNPISPLYPLAHLGLARAWALAGETDKSRQVYQDYFALWKDADPDLPLLIAAKKEYERLK